MQLRAQTLESILSTESELDLIGDTVTHSLGTGLMAGYLDEQGCVL